MIRVSELGEAREGTNRKKGRGDTKQRQVKRKDWLEKGKPEGGKVEQYTDIMRRQVLTDWLIM